VKILNRARSRGPISPNRSSNSRKLEPLDVSQYSSIVASDHCGTSRDIRIKVQAFKYATSIGIEADCWGGGGRFKEDRISTLPLRRFNNSDREFLSFSRARAFRRVLAESHFALTLARWQRIRANSARGHSRLRNLRDSRDSRFLTPPVLLRVLRVFAHPSDLRNVPIDRVSALNSIGVIYLSFRFSRPD